MEFLGEIFGHVLSFLSNRWLGVVLDRTSLQECSQLKSFIVIALVGFQLNWLNLFHFFILEEGLLAILIDVIKMSMPAVSFLTKLDFVIIST